MKCEEYNDGQIWESMSITIISKSCMRLFHCETNLYKQPNKKKKKKSEFTLLLKVFFLIFKLIQLRSSNDELTSIKN